MPCFLRQLAAGILIATLIGCDYTNATASLEARGQEIGAGETAVDHHVNQNIKEFEECAAENGACKEAETGDALNLQHSHEGIKNVGQGCPHKQHHTSQQQGVDPHLEGAQKDIRAEGSAAAKEGCPHGHHGHGDGHHHHHDHHHDHHDHHHDDHHDHHGHHHDHQNHHHDHQDHDHHDHDYHSHGVQGGALVKNSNAWQEAFAGTIAITLGGNAVILLFIRHDLSTRKLHVMLAFACGALLGDVFLHLLPHAIEAQSHEGGHHHHHGEDAEPHVHDLSVGLAVLAGIMVFYVVEKFLRLAGQQSGAGGHGHSHGPKGEEKSPEIEVHDLFLGIRPAAILNMVGDALHNFTDGLSIAAAFQSSRAMGLTVTLAMFLHEIPHEVGDYAVLVSQGLSRWGAFKAQFVSALGALLGCWFGLVVGSDQPVFILAFTAGGFVYIAMSSILPQLIEDSTSGALDIVFQACAMSLGIYMMVLIAGIEAH